MNIVQKIPTEASGKEQLHLEEIVEAEMNPATIYDVTGPIAVQSWRKLGEEKVWDPDRIVAIFDHTRHVQLSKLRTIRK